MFSKEFWYIGFLTILLITMEVFAVLFLARHKWTSRIVLWSLALFMFIDQCIQLHRTHTFSFAFSTIAYWCLITGVLVPFRLYKSFAAAFSFLAGCVYTSGFLLDPTILTHQGPFDIGYMNGYLLHDVLIVGALLMYTQFEVKKYDAAVIGGLIGVVVLLVELGTHVFGWQNINDFLRGVIEGTVLKDSLFPQLQLTWWWYILWYIMLCALLWGIWEIIRLINKRLLGYGNKMPGKLVW